MLPRVGILMPHLKLTRSVTAESSLPSLPRQTLKKLAAELQQGGKAAAILIMERLVRVGRRVRPAKHYLFNHFYIYVGDEFCNQSVFLMILPGSKGGNETKIFKS